MIEFATGCKYFVKSTTLKKNSFMFLVLKKIKKNNKTNTMLSNVPLGLLKHIHVSSSYEKK